MPGTVEVIGGVDTHTIRHCAAAIDEQGRLLGVHEFDANETGHRRLAVVVPLLASTACRAASMRFASRATAPSTRLGEMPSATRAPTALRARRPPLPPGPRRVARHSGI